MKSRDFCYWLKGYLELTNEADLTAEQVDTIERHLDMVFIHEIDPSFPKPQQAALDQAHTPPSTPQGWGFEPGMKC